MSEKTMVTIDCDLTIPEDVEKVFENQHIVLEAGIRCNGKLIFRDCAIEPVATQSVSKRGRRACKPGCIEANGTLQMEGCEIIRPVRGFLSGRAITVKNTSFLLVPPYDAIISFLEEAQVEGCSFVEKAENGPQTTVGNMIPFCSAKIKNCTFDNISGKIDVDTLSGCSFTGCVSIESVDIIDSTFTDCKSVTANSGCFRNCDFVHVEDVSALSSAVDSCRFQNIENDKEDEGIVFLDDSKMKNCTFDGSNLHNGSYLIHCVGDSSVEDCKFTNCRTDREDSELCRMERSGGAYIQGEMTTSVPMGLLKGALKLAGSAALAAAGAAATIMREAASATGSDVLSDVAGTIQDASFEKIRDMWGGDDATKINKMCQKIDRMNEDELFAYMEKLVLDMDEEDMEEFSKKVDVLPENDDEKAIQQVRELLKEATKARGVPGSIDEEAKAKRAEERAESARRSGEQFVKRYEKEKAKFDKEYE